MNGMQARSILGIIIAAGYALISTSPFWPLVVTLAALSGYNLATATERKKSNDNPHH